VQVSADACGSNSPANDLCTSVTPEELAAGGSVAFSGDSEGATLAGDAVQGSLIAQVGLPNVWHAFTLETCADLTVAYCGTEPAFSNVWNLLATSCPADALVFSTANNTVDCSDGNRTAYYTAVQAGTYFIPVLVDPFSNSVGPYTVTVSAEECTLGIDEPAHNWSVFPNPGSGVFQVRTGDLQGLVAWELSDASGRVVHSEQRAVIGGSEFGLRTATPLAPGTYLLRASHPGGTNVERIMIR
jgi:hypothetical protein